MFGIHDLPLFILAGLLLNITPGPDLVYIAGRTASQGPRAGVAAALGISAGCLVHAVAAAIGLSAILMASAEAFFVVKLIGAAYLLYVGISMLREKRTSALAVGTALPRITAGKVFWQGFLTNVLNPKVALFFLAFLPQFIAADSANKPLAFALLGLIFIFNSLFITLPFVAVVAAARQRALTSSNPGHVANAVLWLNRSCGALFVLLGLRLAFTERAV